MKKTIVVTQKDIDRGERRQSHACPIALAAKRGLHTPELSVGPWHVYLKADRRELVLPPRAFDFIKQFDSGEHVKPFRFTIDIPDEAEA